MQWVKEVKLGGFRQPPESGHMSDPFTYGLQEARQSGWPIATVESKVSHWGDHVSVGFTVTIQCVQTREHIEAAAQLAFVTATRFVNEATSRLDRSMVLLPTQ